MLTEDECAPSNPAFREFVEIANENSEHDFYVASDERVFKHFNLPRGQPHFIFHRKPEVQLKGENLIEVWDKTQTMRQFFDKEFILEVDYLENNPHFRNPYEGDVAYVIYNAQ